MARMTATSPVSDRGSAVISDVSCQTVGYASGVSSAATCTVPTAAILRQIVAQQIDDDDVLGAFLGTVQQRV